MEFIIANEKGEEVTLLTDKQYIDIETGEGNTFSIQISKKYQKKWGIDSGWWIGCPGTEYGGIIDGVKSVNETIALSGKTWRGLLEKKIIEPPSGQDYRFVSGDANTILNNIVCSEFDGIFVCDELSGISLNNFQFDRYVTYLAGIEKMLLSKNAKLEIKYNSGEANGKSFIEIRAVPIIDYSEQIEYSKDGTLYYIYFSFEKFTGGINHLICLGKGELKDRLVLHLYADENGNIGTEQHFFGADEREATYDYSGAGSEEDLRKNGTEKFKELLSYKSMDMDLFNESLAGLRGINDDISIGDIVGGRDFDTGIYLSKQITRKIVQVKNGRESIEYGVGKPVLNRNSANAPAEQQSYLQRSDVVDNLLSTATNLPLSAKQGKILATNLSNPNLLINGDFRVNQRGKTIYESTSGLTYTVDRWFVNGVRRITVNDGFITLKATDDKTSAYMNQCIEDLKWGDGKVYTLSANTNGTVKSFTFTNNGTNQSKTFGDGTDLCVETITRDGRKIFTVSVGYYNKGTSIDFYWVKLEQGSIATPFAPRHYAEELAMCQRYYEMKMVQGDMRANETITDGYILTSFHLAPKRVNPTITFCDRNDNFGYISRVSTSGSNNNQSCRIYTYTTSYKYGCYEMISDSGDKALTLSGFVYADAEIY